MDHSQTDAEQVLVVAEKTESVTSSHAQETLRAPPARTAPKNLRGLQALVFLVIWPVGNLLLVSAVLLDFGLLRFDLVGLAALRVWLIFGSSLLVIRFLEWRFPTALDADRSFPYGLIHIAVVLAFGALTGTVFDPSFQLPRPGALIGPRVVVALEIAVYITIVRILRLQRRSFEITARARDAELNVLRAQSNPHFLFNTLNLVTAEIPSDPTNAREIVFDLSDLLRSSIKMAQQNLSTLAEEMNLARLYLGLQQKRFRDRLTYEVELGPRTSRIKVPSLLLQPVVENTIKWAVAPYASKAHIRVETALVDENLSIFVKDTGPPFDETQIVEGDGFRILRETLELYYRRGFKVKLRSTAVGGVFSLLLPLSHQ